MAAIDPLGGQQYWFNGAPFPGVNKTGNNLGGLQFWFNGVPGPYIFPTSAIVTSTRPPKGRFTQVIWFDPYGY